MFNFTRKQARMNEKKNKTIAILSSLVLSLIVNAQTKGQPNDSALLDSFIQSKGYGDTIAFSSSNIKQFWTDKHFVNILSASADIDNNFIFSCFQRYYG